MRTLLAVPLMLYASLAHAADYRVDFTAEPWQVSRMAQGVETVDSVQLPTVVRVFEPEDWMEDRASVFIATFNGGDVPFNFGPENVFVILPDGTRQGMASFDALVREEKGRQRRRKFGVMLGALAGGMQASQAGQFNGQVYSSSGHPIASFTGTDNGARAQAQANANAHIASDAAEVRRRNAEGMAALGGVMRTTTVDPGKAYGGRVLFAFPKEWRKDGEYPVTVEVTSGGAVHLFRAKITRK